MSSKKPGRNQPCPCGSGAKSKRCCGDPLKALAEERRAVHAAGVRACRERDTKGDPEGVYLRAARDELRRRRFHPPAAPVEGPGETV